MTHVGGSSGTDVSAHQEQRVSTQVDRNRWDAEWIAGQRSATDVIRNEGRGPQGERSPGQSRSGSAEGTFTEELAFGTQTKQPLEPWRAERNGEPSRAAKLEASSRAMNGDAPSSAGSLTSASAGTPRDATTAATSSGGAAPAVVSPQSQAPPSAVDIQPLVSTSSGSAAGLRKSFALWRSDDAVRLAMRLRDPAQAGGIVAALRSWLRDAGLTLTQVIVNGRSQEAPTPRASDPNSQTGLNTRI